jgi:hypothetical protein
MERRVTICSLFFFASAVAAFAQSNPIFVQFRPAKGALYKPDTGRAPNVAILVVHSTGNTMSGLPPAELARRGFMVLGLNTRFENNEAAQEWENIALDIKSGIEFLRKQPGITKVLLYGGSSGGPTVSFYQAVAETGVAFCQDSRKLTQCSNDLAGLPPADGVIFRDAHPGDSVNAVRHINPAVMDESDPRKINPELDPFDLRHGYNPSGPSHYSAEFREKYFKAQSERMNDLIEGALEKVRLIKMRRDLYPDNDAFIVVRGVGARLRDIDLDIHGKTLKPQKLLKNDGTVVTQIVESVRRPVRGLREENASFSGGTHFLTLKSFLSTYAIRSTDSMDGIDECSSNNSTRCALKNISVPILLTGMGGHYFLRDNEIHYEIAASKDKDYVVIEGATHGITPCTECETTPGQYSNTVKNFFDYVQKWINARF